MFESFFKMLGLHPKPIVVPVHPHLANTVSHAPVHTPIHAPVMANTSPMVASVSRTPTAGPTISVVNLSTVVTDAEVETAVAAIQIQVDRDFAPIWNMPANLVFVPKTATVPATSWVLQVLDNSDQAGALGYHELNTTEVPLAKIFAKTDLENNLSWSVTMSHEILEMIGDPYVDISVFVQTTATEGYLFAFEMCLTGDTRIPLLDGTTPTIMELIGRDEFWVYSTKPDGSIRPGRGHSARLMRKDAEIVKLTLDDGSSVRLTADHLVMLRDGTYCEAGSLTAGTSLMPFYRRKKLMTEGTQRDYEQIYDLNEQDWKFTHRMVEPRCPSGYVRHHVDFNRFNNSPDNIMLMKWDDHKKLHAEHVTATTKAWRDAALADGSHPFLQPQSEDHRQKSREAMIAWNKSEEHRHQASENAILNNAINYIWSNEEAVVKMKKINSIRFSDLNKTEAHKEMLRKILETPEFKQKVSATAKFYNHTRWHTDRNIKSDNCEHCLAQEPLEYSNEFNNHKVVSVEPCGREDVYDISVDEYHNFAIDAGIFVHNCDPVEDDSIGYKINDVLVSDFVLPPFYETGAVAGAKFDFCGHLTAPLSIAPGGYMSIFPVNPTTKGWTQQTGAEGAGKRLQLKGPHSRKAKRSDRFKPKA